MIRSGIFCLRVMALTVLALSGYVPAHAEPVPPGQPDLYQDAMHFLTDGRQDDASEALTKMITQQPQQHVPARIEPQHAGAWLDLAIIQCALGHAAEAERLFQAIESRFSPPPGILEVIASHRATGCKGWQSQNQLSMTLGRGIDNNVNQGAANPMFSLGSGASQVDLELLPEFLPQHDQYTLLSCEYRHDSNSNGGVGFIQFRARKNDSLSKYNTAALALGLEQPWRFGGWEMQGTAALGFLTLGGQLYQTQSQIQARISPPLPLPQHVRVSMLTGVTHLKYTTLANFDSNTTEVSGLAAYQGDTSQLQASAGYLLDHGDVTRLGGDRKGWFAGLQWHTAIVNDITGEMGWSRQHWLSESAYSPGLINQIRHQDTQLLHAALIIPLKTHQSMQIEWRHVRNNENISIFQYNSQLLQVSWRWQNF